MVKCSFCQFDNEDGAIFCEQCKSDLGLETSAGSQPAPPASEVPFAAVIEEPSTPESPVEAVSVEDSPFDFLGQATPTAPMSAMSPAAAPPPVAEVISPTPVPLPQGEAMAGSAAAPTVPPVAAPAKSPADSDRLPADAQPRLVVLRGQKMNVEYPLYEGHNFIGRTDERPVDIDLEDQEPPDRIWSSRQHAVITYEDGKLLIEDLNSSNGTFVNRGRIYPGQKRPLKANDIIQIGTVQMKVRV